MLLVSRFRKVSDFREMVAGIVDGVVETVGPMEHSFTAVGMSYVTIA